MNRYRITQSGGRTFIEKLPEIGEPYLTLYGPRVRPGCGDHRRDYSDADALAVTRWLNEREAGYLPTMFPQ